MNTRKLLETAYACLERNEDEAAKALLTLAVGEDAPEETEEDLKEKAKSAIEDGDYAKAAEIMKDLTDKKEPVAGADESDLPTEEEPSSEEPAKGDVDSSDDEAGAAKKASEEEPSSEEEPAEGETSPGDAVKDLPPEKIAALVTLASTIKKGGHPDLAKRITRVIGL